MQILAGFEADGFAGRNGDLGPGSGIAADPGFARLDGEDTEPAQLDAIALDEALFHGSEDDVDCSFSLGAHEPGAFDDPLD